MLSLLRAELADEIVVAVDSRVEPATLGRCWRWPTASCASGSDRRSTGPGPG